MRFRLPILPLLALALLLVPAAASAQDQDNDQNNDNGPSLGDLARNLRKNKAQQPPQREGPVQTVIDNDNLSQVTEDIKNGRPVTSDKTVLSIDSSGKTLKVSSPDVTCSLSFNARATSLLVKPILIEDLPLGELLKLDGPGFIQDANLQLQVFNGSEWDLREITVGLTLERRPGENAAIAAHARVIPAAQNSTSAIERRSDVTLLYHLKTTAKPLTTTAFRENIGITPGPDEDWRWSIVEAKGIRPGQTQ